MIIKYLPIEFRDDFADSLSSPCRGWDDVLGCSSAVPPGFSTRSVDSLLSGCVSVDCGHQAAGDAESVIDHLKHSIKF